MIRTSRCPSSSSISRTRSRASPKDQRLPGNPRSANVAYYGTTSPHSFPVTSFRECLLSRLGAQMATGRSHTMFPWMSRFYLPSGRISGGGYGAARLPWITVVGPGSGWDIDISSSIERIDRLYRNALDKAELPTGIAKRALRPDLGVFALAGADLPEQEKQTQIAIEKQQWTTSTLVINDTFAILRAGSQRNWGIAVACGAGINCAGKFPNGTLLRFPALGVISGDWGGGYDVGLAALGAASRSEDSRGAPTAQIGRASWRE